MRNIEVTGFVSIVSLAIAASSVAFGLSMKPRGRARLIRYRIEEAGIPEDLDFIDLEVFHRGRVLTRPKLFTVTVHNAGEIALETRSIDRPPRVKFIDGEIVAYRVGSFNPPAEEPDLYRDDEVRKSDREIEAPGRLMNKGAGVVFMVLTDGCSRSPKVFLAATNFELEEEPPAPAPRRRLPVAWMPALVFGVVAVVTGLLALFA